MFPGSTSGARLVDADTGCVPAAAEWAGEAGGGGKSDVAAGMDEAGSAAATWCEGADDFPDVGTAARWGFGSGAFRFGLNRTTVERCETAAVSRGATGLAAASWVAGTCFVIVGWG